MEKTSSLAMLTNSLNLKRSDKLAIYGMGSQARDVLEDLQQQVSSTDAIALNVNELKECEDPNAYVGRPKNATFDRVLCFYSDFPQSSKNIKTVLQTCYDLCSISGMGLVTGLDDNSTVQTFLHGKHVTKFWYMNQSGKKFDLLFSKDNHHG